MPWKIGSREISIVGNRPAVVCFRGFLGSVIGSEVYSLSAYQPSVRIAVESPFWRSSHSLKSCLIYNFSAVAVILRTRASSQVALSVVESVSILMIYIFRMRPDYCSMHGNAKGTGLSNTKTRCCAVTSRFPTGMPLVLLKRVGMPRVYQGILAFRKWKVCHGWAYRTNSFSRRMVTHRFAPVKQFASWVLDTLAATMPPLYAFTEVFRVQI